MSVHFDPGRKTDLETFCNSVVDTVKPSVVIASGDLTDSRTLSPLGSDQIEQEWIWYHQVLNSTRIRDKTIWLDIRGNHGEILTEQDKLSLRESESNFYFFSRQFQCLFLE